MVSEIINLTPSLKVILWLNATLPMIDSVVTMYLMKNNAMPTAKMYGIISVKDICCSGSIAIATGSRSISGAKVSASTYTSLLRNGSFTNGITNDTATDERIVALLMA